MCRNYKQSVKVFGFFLVLSVENGWKVMLSDEESDNVRNI